MGNVSHHGREHGLWHERRTGRSRRSRQSLLCRGARSSTRFLLRSPFYSVTAMDRPFNVLFLCTGNSARSIMAEAILNRAGGGNFHAFSAGSQPKGQVHPHTLELLRKMNFDTSALRSKSWSEFSGIDALALDFVFTVCDNAAGETCPLWAGQPMTAHWGVPDPTMATGNEAEVRLAFADTFRMLSNRISIFVSLPIRSLDRLSLQRQVDGIGGLKSSAA